MWKITKITCPKCTGMLIAKRMDAGVTILKCETCKDEYPLQGSKEVIKQITE